MRALVPITSMLLLGCGPRVSVTNNDAIVELDGYVRACLDLPEIAFPDPGGGWRVSAQPGRDEEPYVLDGVYHGAAFCHAADCVKSEKTTVSFRDIQPTDPHPDHPDVAAYVTARGSGKARISIDYFADPQCTQSRHFEQVITVPKPPQPPAAK